jgi:LysM repeat protein
MRALTKSACVVLAWSILPVILVAAGLKGSVHLAQAPTRTASSTEVILTSTLSVAVASVTATSHTTKYVVQDGDTLSGIAARFGVRGGWPTLYAANRQLIGPDPNVIHPGTVLVLPGQMAPVRHTVAAGDTLSGIAAEFAVRGGWPALYAANRQVIGPDPNVIHSGTVLTVLSPAALSPPTPYRAHPRQHPPTLRPSPPASPRHHPLPVTRGAPAATGMPQWLKTVLLAVGLVILAVFLAGPVLAVRRRRQQAAGRAVQLGKAGVGSRRDRGGRSRSVGAAVRPVAAAARVHPAGVAVPSAVLATGIVLFTFVKSATIRVVPPPGGSGPGSVHAARTGQPHHCLRPRQPGPPGLPVLPSARGQNARSLTGGLGQIASPLPVPAAVPPAGAGRALQASRNPSSRLPGGGLMCDARQVPSSAAAAAAGSGGAGQ